MDSFSPFKVEWCQTFVLQLIIYWEENECLYNTKCLLYRNKHARTEALEAIAFKMQDLIPGVTPTDIKIKINYLRSQYGRELLKLQNANKSGAGTDDLYKPTSYWFEPLSFLKDYVSVRKGKCNLSYASEETLDVESPQSVTKRRKVDLETADDALKKCTEFLHKLAEPEKEDVETANFVRSQLNDITSKDLKDEVTSKIITLLFEYKRKNRELLATYT